MKYNTLIFLFFCVFATHAFPQDEIETIVIEGGEVDTILTSPVLEFTDTIVKSIFDSVVHEEKDSDYYKKTNFFNVIFRENPNVGALEMYIEVSDSFVIWNDSVPYNYGCMYYCDRLFVLYGEYASHFFKRTEEFEKIDMKYMYMYDSFPIIIDPDMWWYFYYKDNWYYFNYENKNGGIIILKKAKGYSE